MGRVVLPFLEYLVFQIFVMIIGFNYVRGREISTSIILKAWIFGQLTIYALFDIIAVPMILMRWKFIILFWSFICVSLVLFFLGCCRLKEIKTWVNEITLTPFAILLIILTLVLILWQAGIYFWGVHLDEDDSRFLAQSNDALEYGQMYIRYHETGELIGRFEPLRDVTSPWTMFLAVMSKLLFTTPAIFAHTIYSPVELFAVYGIYWLIGNELYRKTESRLVVVFLAAVINMFFTSTVYTQSTFTLLRIWQGKATVAAVIVPMLIYLFICINRQNQENIWTWIMVIVTGCAACLMSGAGIPIGLFGIAVLGLYSIVAYKQWKKIPLWIVSMVTPLGSGLLYMFLKGVIIWKLF